VELELELELEASKLKTNALQPSLLASQGIFASDGQAKRFINNGDDGECVGRRLGAELKTLLLPCVLLPTNFDQKVKPHYVLLLLSATVALLYYLHNIYACNFWFLAVDVNCWVQVQHAASLSNLHMLGVHGLVNCLMVMDSQLQRIICRG
jgi:hypothetical protein